VLRIFIKENIKAPLRLTLWCLLHINHTLLILFHSHILNMNLGVMNVIADILNTNTTTKIRYLVKKFILFHFSCI